MGLVALPSTFPFTPHSPPSFSNKDLYEAKERDARLKHYLCGAPYHIYTMPGPPEEGGELVAAQDNQLMEEAPAPKKEACRY